jgi:Rod binding domain-containing protein
MIDFLSNSGASALSTPTISTASLRSTGDDFARVLRQATVDSGNANANGAPASGRAEALREAAANLVSAAFIEPVLASLRDGSQAAGAFAPSTVEKQFGPMLDAEFSSRITASANFPIVDAIVDRYRAAAEMGGA